MKSFINLNQTEKRKLTFDRPGDYVVFFHNLSEKLIVDLTAPGVNVDIYGLYTGLNTDEFEIETVQRHGAPHSTSNLLIKGVFRDRSKFRYRGLIRIEKVGQQSHAYQKNQNLILSPATFVESQPYLEILANDVFCTHGSTTGKPDREQQFYLESRGLSKKKAEDLLVRGFINEIYEKIIDKVPSFKAVDYA